MRIGLPSIDRAVLSESFAKRKLRLPSEYGVSLQDLCGNESIPPYLKTALVALNKVCLTMQGPLKPYLMQLSSMISQKLAFNTVVALDDVYTTCFQVLSTYKHNPTWTQDDTLTQACSDVIQKAIDGCKLNLKVRLNIKSLASYTSDDMLIYHAATELMSVLLSASKASSFEKHLQEIVTLLDSNPYWSRLTEIDKNYPKAVAFRQAIDSDKRVSVDEIYQQLCVFQELGFHVCKTDVMLRTVIDSLLRGLDLEYRKLVLEEMQQQAADQSWKDVVEQFFDAFSERRKVVLLKEARARVQRKKDKRSVAARKQQQVLARQASKAQRLKDQQEREAVNRARKAQKAEKAEVARAERQAQESAEAQQRRKKEIQSWFNPDYTKRKSGSCRVQILEIVRGHDDLTSIYNQLYREKAKVGDGSAQTMLIVEGVLGVNVPRTRESETASSHYRKVELLRQDLEVVLETDHDLTVDQRTLRACTIEDMKPAMHHFEDKRGGDRYRYKEAPAWRESLEALSKRWRLINPSSLVQKTQASAQ